MAFFKDDPALQAAPMPAGATHRGQAGHDALQEQLVGTYNRIGGLLGTIAAEAGISPRSVVAVWQVESGGMDFVKDQSDPSLREPQILRALGKAQQRGVRSALPVRRAERHSRQALDEPEMAAQTHRETGGSFTAVTRPTNMRCSTLPAVSPATSPPALIQLRRAADPRPELRAARLCRRRRVVRGVQAIGALARLRLFRFLPEPTGCSVLSGSRNG